MISFNEDYGNVNCLNGGTCHDGICECTDVYLGENCETAKIDLLTSKIWEASYHDLKGEDITNIVKDLCYSIEKIDDQLVIRYRYVCDSIYKGIPKYIRFNDEFTEGFEYDPESVEDSSNP